GIKYINLLFISLIKLTPFRPSASLVAIPNKTGLRFLIVALAAINTGVSVIALAIRLMELPVKGAIIIKSSGNFGPRGSASGIVLITFFPVIFSILSICFFVYRISYLYAVQCKILSE